MRSGSTATKLATMSDFELRPLSEADRTYLARLNFLTDTFGEEHKELTPQFDADFDYYLAGWEPSRGGFIAWQGNVPTGGVWLNWGTEQRHGYGHVEEGIPELALAVEPRYRSQGVGTLLLRAATDLARDLGAPGVSLSVALANKRAHRLYLFMGFEPVGESEGHVVLVKRF